MSEPTPHAQPESQPAPAATTIRLIITALLIALLALSWTKALDLPVANATAEKFQRALAVAAIARGLNGVISVAQGTEVAIQPVGVGVTLTLGEILDPLNDLVERFSMLALIASSALGLQMVLGTIAASTWFSALLSTMMLAYLICLWWPTRASYGAANLRHHFQRALGVAIFARFLVTAALLLTHWVDTTFLQQIQRDATAQLDTITSEVKALEAQSPEPPAPEQDAGFIDRTYAELEASLDRLLDQSSATFDIEARMQALQVEVERSVEQMINLIVVFLLQTLLLPLLGAYLCLWSLRLFWRQTGVRSKGQVH